MSIAIEGLLFGLNKNVDYAQRLVADLSDAQMVAQPSHWSAEKMPAAGLANHPAWVLSHLNVYVPVMMSLIRGEEFPDPKLHPFGMQSKPQWDRAVYASKQELIGEFVAGHAKIAEMLSGADDRVLEQAVKLPRWAAIMPKVGLVLPYLLLVHENQHLGQVSAWRRVLELPAV